MIKMQSIQVWRQTMITNQEQQPKRETTQLMLAGLLAQRKLGFLHRLAARAE